MNSINGFPGYFVDERGTIYGLKGRPLVIRVINTGYQSVQMSRDKKPHYRLAHRVVAEAFLPNYTEELCVNHKDGNRLNNHVNNLEMVTYKQNTAHAIRTGGIKQNGSQSVNAKLTEDEVKILRKIKPSFTYRQLAEIFNMHAGYLALIIQKRRWTHI